jgi:hypothetical protein
VPLRSHIAVSVFASPKGYPASGRLFAEDGQRRTGASAGRPSLKRSQSAVSAVAFANAESASEAFVSTDSESSIGAVDSDFADSPVESCRTSASETVSVSYDWKMNFSL